MTAPAAVTLHELEAALERHGLLLLHDRALPSVTALVVGAPVAGSWWGHPLGKQIYALAEQLEGGAGALSAKLINGKVTFVARSLWPALLSVAQSVALRERCTLSAVARALDAELTRRGSVSIPELRAEGFAAATELTKALGELELQVLCHVSSEHGAGGAHHKRLSSWRHWASQHGAPEAAALPSTRTGWDELEARARALGGSASARLPWPAPL